MTGPIDLGPVAAAMSPKSATIDMVITRADGRVEHQSVTTTFGADGQPLATTETFGKDA